MLPIRRNQHDSSCRRPASVLVLVLFVMVVLQMAAVSFAYRAAIKGRSSRHREIAARLRNQACSAAAVAMSQLLDNTNDFDHAAEAWATPIPLDTKDWLAEWSPLRGNKEAEYTVAYRLVDENRKLNVLYASGEMLQKLGLSAEQIDSLYDWMDPDVSSRPEGAKDEYYLRLSDPYRCKGAPIETLDELLLVRGFSPADYFGAARRRRGFAQVPEELPDDPRHELIGWVDLLTTLGDGKINLNTASKPVLAALPLSPGAADQIAAFRRYTGSGKIEDHVFRALTDIDQLQGLMPTDKQVLKQMTCFQSDHFRVFVQARHVPTGLRYQLEVLVRALAGNVRILEWKART